MAAPRTSMLTMENIRCFSKGTLALRPLTILLGENSTGKTTALACHQTSHELLGKRNPDFSNAPFNQFPHSMGNFHDIVRKRITPPGSKGKTKKRVILTHEYGQLTCKSFYFENKHGMIEIESLFLSVLSADQPTLELQLSDNDEISKIEGHTKTKLTLRIPRKLLFEQDMKKHLKNSLLSHIKKLVVNDDIQPVGIIDKIIKKVSKSLPYHELVSIPARKPGILREYEVMDKEVANGYDMLPHRLRKLQIENEKTYQELVSRLNKLGQATKTFDKFKIVNKSDGQEHFMLMAERDGRIINLCDMGTGIWPAIAQFIPVELESIAGRAKQFHLQHLDGGSHPRLAAELVSWLCEKTNQGNMLIVKTHSDYDLMRLTVEICKGNVDPDDVAVAYFEHDERTNKSKVYNLRYNEDGYIVDPPDCFRKFYYSETSRYVLASRKRYRQ